MIRSKLVVTVLFALLANVFWAQSFQGIATYEKKTGSEELEKTMLADPKMDPQMKKFIREKLKNKLNKTYVLQFDKSTSIYKEERKISIENASADGSWSPYGMTNSYFKNTKDKIGITEKDLMSKFFSVQEVLPAYNWKLESETKQIGTYLCNKAIAILPVSEQERKEYEKSKISQEKNKTQFIPLEEPREKVITVWYTTDIPVNHGPEGYWGLPGLILEVNDGENILLCSKVVLNPNEKFIIQATKRKPITQEEYDRIVEAKLKELESFNFSPSKQ